MIIFKSLRDSFEQLTQLNLPANFSDILKQPVAILTVLGLLLLIVVFIKARKINFTARLLTHVAMAVALSTILSIFKVYEMPQGGSVTFGSMVPILFISLLYGPEVGFLAGTIYGIISLILGPYILHPIQVLFDYPLPFMMLGAAGYFKRNRYIATLAAVILRFACHVISGVVFFASSAPKGQSPILYSILYNGSYLLPELIICLVIMAFLPLDRLFKAISKA